MNGRLMHSDEIARLIERLADPDEIERCIAIADLKEMGTGSGAAAP